MHSCIDGMPGLDCSTEIGGCRGGGQGVFGGWRTAVDTEAGCLCQCDRVVLKGRTGTNENNAQ